MAATKDVVGILFGVEGGSSVEGASYKLINEALNNIVKEINKNPKEILFTASDASLKKIIEDINSVMSKQKDMTERLTSATKDLVSERKSQSSQSKKTTENISEESKRYKELKNNIVALYKEAAKLQNLQSQDSERIKGDLFDPSSPVELANVDRDASLTKFDYSKRIDEFNKLRYSLGGLLNEINAIDKDVVTGADMSQLAQSLGISVEHLENLLQVAQNAHSQYAIKTEESLNRTKASWDKYSANFVAEIDRMMEALQYNSPALASKALDIRKTLTESTDPTRIQEAKEAFRELRREVDKNGAALDSWGLNFKKTFDTRVRSILSALIIGKVSQAIRSIYTNTVELDKAMTQIRIATGKTREETQALIESYVDLGKQMGITGAEIAESANTWLRQGYTTAEAEELIRNSAMLAKLGMIDATTAATNLTSAMKGYKVSVEESIGIVDKFTAVDMKAAASAGDIATAMAETASSADVAGVSMDKLIGYIAVVKEVTQDGAESVGTFFKTMFARMNNVKAQKFVDDNGEALNDVEKVLTNLGISLRDSNGLFRASSSVLDEVAAKWENFDNVQQHAIATQFAGTRQQEKFMVLMENYSNALKYTAVSTESAGTALIKYDSYLESIEGRINSLKASFEAVSMSILDSKLLSDSVLLIGKLIDGINAIVSTGDGVILGVTALIAIIALLTKNVIKLKNKFTEMKTAGVGAFKTIGVTAGGTEIKLWQLQLAIVAITTALTAAISIADKISTAWKNRLNDLNDAIAKEKELSNEYSDEIASLKTVSETLRFARNDRSKLADIYDKLNGKISVSTNLLRGENDAYNQTTEAVRDRIVYLEKLEKLSAERGKALAAEASETLAIDRGGFMDYLLALDFRSIASGQLSTITSDQIRTILSGLRGASDGERAFALSKVNLSEQQIESWVTQQVEYTKQFMYDKLAETSSIMTRLGSSSIIEMLVRSGFDPKEVDRYFSNLDYSLDKWGIEDKIIAYYEAVSGRDAKNAQLAYNEIVDSMNTVIRWYPEVEEVLTSYVVSLARTNEETMTYVVTLKSLMDFFNETEDPFNTIISALKDINEIGRLSVSTIEKMIDNDRLKDYLQETADGYVLVDNAMNKFFADERANYLREMEIAESAYNGMVEERKKGNVSQAAVDNAYEQLQNAIANAESWLRVEAIYARSEILEDYKELLQGQIDALEKQNDAYKELCNIRKELLKTYQKELDYQRKLEKAQKNVSSLSTRLAVSRLDTSAAGIARTRALEAELKEAQEEFDDITLEHAIDVLEEDIDNQMQEYETFIKTEIEEIEKAIKTSVSQATADIIAKLLENGNKEYQANPTGTDSSGEIRNTDDASYTGAIQNAESIDLANIVRYGTRVFTNEPGTSGLVEKGDLPDDTNGIASSPGYRGERGRGADGSGHRGGRGGEADKEDLFWGLLNQNLVTKPEALSKIRGIDLLTNMTTYKTGSTEINSPLVTITCGTVTEEVLPSLKTIVNDAADEVFKRLSGGLSRTGTKNYVRPALKVN